MLEKVRFSVPVSVPKSIALQVSKPGGKGDPFCSLFEHVFPAENIEAGEVLRVQKGVKSRKCRAVQDGPHLWH